jgi:hypothetical protein
VKTLYMWWARLLLLAVVIQIGLAGYGAFYVANKVDGDGKTIDQDGFESGFGAHMGFGYIIWLLGLIFLVIGIAAGIGRWRLGKHGVLALLLTLQIVLAWIGSGVPAVGAFHPLNAMVILVLLLWIVHDTTRGKVTAPVAVAPPAAT